MINAPLLAARFFMRSVGHAAELYFPSAANRVAFRSDDR
jgi:hypothetical protein